MTDKEKKHTLQPLLSFWAKSIRNGKITRLELDSLSMLFKHLDLCKNIDTVLSSIDTKRKTISLNPKYSINIPFYYGFWDLRWMDMHISRVIVPMDVYCIHLTEKQFASYYFDEKSYYAGDIFFWNGKVRFRIEYVDQKGQRTVQDKDMYLLHKQYCLEKKWAIPKDVLPRSEIKLVVSMCRQWLIHCFSSFLEKHIYNIKMMSSIVIKEIYTHSVLLKDFVQSVYNIVGRLHPYFPLSRSHNVLKERIRHLYFDLESLSELPLCLSFTEYFSMSDNKKRIADSLWDRHFEVFQTILVSQCAFSSFCVDFGKPLQGWFVTHYSSSSLSRNDHHTTEGKIIPLGSVVAHFGRFFYDEDIVPNGLESVGVLVDAPPFYCRPTKESETVEVGIEETYDDDDEQEGCNDGEDSENDDMGQYADDDDMGQYADDDDN